MRAQKYFAAPAVALLVAGCAIPVGTPAPSPSNRVGASAGNYSATEARIFDLINAERQHRGLPALVYNAQLDRMAKIQAENMAYFQKMAHKIPESQLPTLGDRARHVGYPFGRLAENVALGYPNAETVVQGWMNSSGHRRNILDGSVEETGIGIARSSAGGLYYCQVFGKRLTSL
ncbi:MAG TPA: CAP domain-containing protein [Gemmatimonadaceae bacterium]